MHLLEALAGVCLLLFTLPLTVELILLTAAAAFPRGPHRRASGTDLALHVIVPAHNEEQLIGQCVQSLIAGSASNVSVFVVAHNCTDRTAERARAHGANVLVLNDAKGGKGAALDFGFQHALSHKAAAVLVIDADSAVSPNLTRLVTETIAGGADALQCRYQVANASATPRTRLVALAFSGMNVLRPRGRGRLGLSCGIFGNGFALSSDTLSRVPYVANSVVEDLEYHLLVMDAGRRVVFLDEATVYGEMPTTTSGSATQRARWEGGRILMRRQWAPRLFRAVLGGRLRMLEPLLDLLSLPLASQAALLMLALLIPLAWVRLYACLGLFGMAGYIVLAAGLGTEPARTLTALVSVPGYMLWKLLLYPRTRLAAQHDAAWIRTKRNS